MKKSRDGLKGRAALLTTTLIWGTSFVILKNTLDSITPVWVMAIRFGGASILMLLFAIPKLKKLDKGYLKGGAVMGVCLALGYIVQTYGLNYTTPGKNAFLTATYCILVPFLNWMIVKKKPDIFNIVAAVMCLVGISLVCLSGADKLTDINIGDILTIMCGLFYALHIIATGKFAEDKDPLLLSLVQFSVAALFCLVSAAIFEPVPKNIPNNAWYSIAYLSLMCTGACFFLQTVGQKYTPPSAASLILILESVFGTAVSMLVGQENMTLGIGIGFVIIFTALLISETKLSFLKKQ